MADISTDIIIDSGSKTVTCDGVDVTFNKVTNSLDKTKFISITEAQEYIKKYPCKGLVFTINNGSEWLPYVVGEDNSLNPISQTTVGDITDIRRIDGGTAFN